MTPGRQRQLNASSFEQGAIAGHDVVNFCADERQQRTTILHREITARGDQALQQRILAAPGLTEPCEMKPHTQIGNARIVQIARQRRLVGGRAHQHRQRRKGRPTPQHRAFVYGQTALHQPGTSPCVTRH